MKRNQLVLKSAVLAALGVASVGAQATGTFAVPVIFTYAAEAITSGTTNLVQTFGIPNVYQVNVAAGSKLRR